LPLFFQRVKLKLSSASISNFSKQTKDTEDLLGCIVKNNYLLPKKVWLVSNDPISQFLSQHHKNGPKIAKQLTKCVR